MTNTRLALWVALLFALFFVQCGNKDVASYSGKVKKQVVKAATASLLNQPNYNTFTAKARVKYSDISQNISFNANFRNLKDSLVWVSLTGPLGIEGGRALITPDTAKIINRLHKEYTIQPISYTKQFIPIELSVGEIQQLIYGYWFPFNIENLKYSYEDDLLVANTGIENVYEATIYMNPKNYTVTKYRLKDEEYNHVIVAKFDDYEDLDGYAFAHTRSFEVSGPEINATMSLSFSKPKTNTSLRFPFTINPKYKRI